MTKEEAIARIKDHIAVHKYLEREAIYIIEALNMAIKALERDPWIPVSERLPEELEDVLVCTKSGYVTCGCYVNDYNYRCVDEDLFLNLGDVVAWMPLPKPWKGEKDELRSQTSCKGRGLRKNG